MATSTKPRLEALQHEHDVATAELTELTEQISALEDEQSRIKLPAAAAQGAASDAERRFGDLGAQLSTMRARVDDLTRHQLRRLEKRLEHLRRSETCARDMDAARSAHAAAKDEIAVISARRAQVESRLTAMQHERSSASGKFCEAEQLAAQVFAQSVSEGNARAIEAAETRLKAAQAARMTFEQEARHQQAVIDALQAEVARLQSAEHAAEGRLKAAREAFGQAVELKYAVKWDAAVDQLALAGASLAAARRISNGETYYLFRGLKVSRQEPDLSELTAASIIRQSEDLVLPESL
jgi:chromosome segregation ATPase